MDNYHLLYKDDQWKFTKEGSEKSIRNFETKDAAMSFGIDYMNNHGGSFKIHKQDGRFQEERTYPGSADPHKSKG